MSTYFELLKHPKWQRKRLEIMEREEYKCQWCTDSEAQLSVHHTYYKKGCKPWEYPTKSLLCLCDDCHKKAEALRNFINEKIGGLFSGLYEIAELVGFLQGLPHQNKIEEIRGDDYKIPEPFRNGPLVCIYGIEIGYRAAVEYWMNGRSQPTNDWITEIKNKHEQYFKT